MGIDALWYHSFIFLSFVAPALPVAAVLVLRLNGVRYHWAALLAFGLWMGLIGWFNYWLITSAWAFV
jgi:hypothetical protein